MNISLPDELKKWVDKQVQSGGFGTASEYVRDMLRRAKERDAQRNLEVLILEGIESGPLMPLDEAAWASIRRDARAAARKGAGKR